MKRKPSTKSRSQASGRRSIEHSFSKVFKAIEKKLTFESASVERLAERMLDALIQAATSKCLEFNIAANQTGKGGGPAFSLVSNLRGICEDLIYLTYLSRMEGETARKLITQLLQQNTARGVAAQRNFFAANNPFQPVLGASMSEEQVQELTTEAREGIRKFWKDKGCSRRDGPTIFELAAKVGLNSTYEYIYFAASNFVHFNPQALLRMGWGPKSGPFVFSIANMDGYYRSFSSFYGAILFIGFHASFGSAHFKCDLDREVARLLELIDHVQRWPEVITFEEMNQKPPLYLITHALGKLMRTKDKKIPYGAILKEVQSLRVPQIAPT